MSQGAETETMGEEGQNPWYFDLAKPIIQFIVATGVIVALWWLVENVQAAEEVVVPLAGLTLTLVFAYFMFDWIVSEEHFPRYSNQYDVAFLVAGILIVGWLGLILYSNVDEIVESIQ